MSDGQKNIRYQKSMIDTLYDNVLGFIFVCKIEDEIEIIDANSVFCKYFGYEESLQNYVINFGSNALIDEIYLRKDQLHNVETTFNCSISHSNERRDYFIVKIIPLTDEKNTYIIACADISDQRRAQEQLEIEHERYKVALECSKDTLFEYTVSTDLLVTYGIFGNDSIKKDTIYQIPNYRTRLLSGERCHPDDIEKIFKALDDKFDMDLEVRLVSSHEFDQVEYKWALIKGKTYYNEDGVIKIIGKMSDIHQAKMDELKRMETLYLDQLTGIYNNERMEYLIEQHATFCMNHKYAIIILDVVNFGNFNATYGISFGDILLKDITETLSSRINNHDILARIGGDEFMILVKDSIKYDLNKYASNISKPIKIDYFGDNAEETLEFSVGFAQVNDNEDYKTVIDNAKKAVTYAKTYSEKLITPYCEIANDIDNDNLKLDYLASDYYRKDAIITDDANNLVSFSLDLLERVEDTRKAMNMLLTRITKIFNLDQINIYETNPNTLTCNSLYRVKKKPIPLDFHFQYNSVEEFNEAYSRADSDGFILLSLEDIEKKVGNINAKLDNQDTLEILISIIKNEGQPAGFISFHSDKKGTFNSEMRTRLKEVSKIIGAHINKASSDYSSKLKSEFLSRMSHEIRTPMNAIIGMTDIAMSCIEDTDRVKDSLVKISISTKYLLSIVNDILDMSKIENGKVKLNIEKFSITKLIDDIDTLIKPQALNKGIEFSVIKNYENDFVYGDEIKLTQVLVNISGNAVKFTNKGGKIILLVEQVLNEDDVIVYRFLVKDNGIGINNKKFSQIFNAFEQAEDDTSEKYGGTGLGLSISNSILRMMGTHIEVKSKQGVGSEFYFTLAFRKNELDQDALVEEVEKELEIPIYDFSGRRVLVAEDNELNLEIAQTILMMAGFETDTCSNGLEAYNKFMEHDINYYDIILMDIRMPVLDGIGATKKIRASQRSDAKSIPIIAMTANAFDFEQKNSLENGMNAHLSKPIDTDKLYKTIKENLKNEGKA